MINLNIEDKREQGRKSSKGNQLKFERDGIWYKADYLGYEGLAEYVVSKLLSFSDLKPNEYVDYDLEQIRYNENIFNGCKSHDFTDGWNLITLERLFKSTFGYGLNKMIYTTPDHHDRLRMMTEKVEQITGLNDFGVYMCKMLAVDALFLNEDRHTHNIAVMTNDRGEYRYAPLFDHGAGLLADTGMDYPLTVDTQKLIDRVRSKTICEDFTEQLDIAEDLFGYQIHFTFGYSDVKNIVDQADIYDEETRARVIEVVMEMRRRYSYMFV